MSCLSAPCIPLALDLATGDKISVGVPYFNQTFLPVFGLAMLFAGIGPFLSWKRAHPAVVLRRAALTTLLSLAGTVALGILIGFTPFVGLLGAFIALWLAIATLQDLATRAGLPNASVGVALRRTVKLPRSAWGLYLGHLGLAIAAAGVVAVSVWKEEIIQVSQLGDATDVGPFTYTLETIENGNGPNCQTTVGSVIVTRGDKTVATLHPERRWYPVEKRPSTEAGILSLWHGDVYAVLGGPDGQGGHVTRYYYNPGVPWMWLGALLISVAALVSLSDRRLRIGAPRTRRSAAPQPAE